MSLNFKSNLNEIGQSGNTAQNSNAEAAENGIYNTPGYVRNLCFVWPDGRRKFCSYAYLLSGEIMPGENIIRLSFTNETATIEGNHLHLLFDSLLQHLPKEIICSENRYLVLSEKNASLITSIAFEPNA